MPKLGSLFPSNYLKKEDFNPPRIMTIESVVVEDVGIGERKEMKPVVYFKGEEKGLILNVGNANMIGEQYGDDTDDWNGARVEIYDDPNVMYQGKRTGGTRIRIPAPRQAGGSDRRREPEPEPEDQGHAGEEIPF